MNAKSASRKEIMLRKKLGDYLQSKREEFGYSRQDVANDCGWKTSQYLYNIEKGISWPPVYLLKILAKKYKIPRRQLFEFFVDLRVQVWKHEYFK